MSAPVELEDGAPRFEFGRNWHDFIQKKFGKDRVEASKQKILDFLGRENLEGLDMIDIGCGSGLHSVAALEAGAKSVHGFDYDPNSVEATKFVQNQSGNPPNWTVEQGSVLDDVYMESLPQYDLVYSWGVLHHTGDVWHAARNAAERVKPGGLFFIALYSSDAPLLETPKFWLDVKRNYVSSGWLKRRCMDLWYIWRFQIDRKISRIPKILLYAWRYKQKRGMNFMTDIRDWLGGWPMEFVGDQETVDFVEKMGFKLENMVTGQAITEFLFVRNHAAKRS